MYLRVHPRKSMDLRVHPCLSAKIHGFTRTSADTIEIPGKAWVWQCIQAPGHGSEAKILGVAVKTGSWA